MNRIQFFIIIQFFICAFSSVLIGVEDHYDIVMAQHSKAAQGMRKLDNGRMAVGNRAFYEKDFTQLAQLFKVRRCVKRVNSSTKTSTKKYLASLDVLEELHILSGDHAKPACCIALDFPAATISGRVNLYKRLACQYSRDKLRDFQKDLLILKAQPELIFKLYYSLCEITSFFTHLSDTSTAEEVILSLWDEQGSAKKYILTRILELPFCSEYANAMLTAIANATPEEINRISVAFVPTFCKYMIPESSTETIIKHRAHLKSTCCQISTFIKAAKVILQELENAKLCPKLAERIAHIINSSAIQRLIELQNELGDFRNPTIGDFQMACLGYAFMFYRHACSIKAELLELLYYIGKVDMLTAVAARLYTVSDLSESMPRKVSSTVLLSNIDRQRHAYNFVIYTQYCINVAITDYWYPLFDKSEFNSIKISQNEPRIVVISGPNMSGKTTTLRALGTCAYLANTLGIAPAKRCILPLSYINTMLRVCDTEGNGLLDAHEKRINKVVIELLLSQTLNIVNAANNIINNTSTESLLDLVFIDEPFNAADSEKANKKLIEFLEQLKKFGSNALVFITTHLAQAIKHAEDNPQVYSTYYSHHNQNFKIDKNKPQAQEHAQAVTDILEEIDPELAQELANLEL